MAVRGETMPHGARLGMTVEAGGLDWFRRLWQWLRGVSTHGRQIGPVSQYGTWDPRREQFKPLRAEAAVDLLAAQNGAAWSARIYNSSI
jgi:hypothetical protein